MLNIRYKPKINAKAISHNIQLHYVMCSLISGRHTTDVYHTEKSFLMIEHMCQEHGGHFDWFMRAVDDAYVDVARLRHLVSKLDPDKEVCFVYVILYLAHHHAVIEVSVQNNILVVFHTT